MKEKELKVVDEKVLPIPMLGNEHARIEGDTFYLAEYDYGIVFHSYNSIDVIIRPNMTSAYGLLSEIIKKSNTPDGMTEEERQTLETLCAAVTYIFLLPTYAFSDIDFLFKTATNCIDYIKSTYETAMNEPLQDETPQENLEFENAVMAVEHIKKEVEESKEK